MGGRGGLRAGHESLCGVEATPGRCFGPGGVEATDDVTHAATQLDAAFPVIVERGADGGVPRFLVDGVVGPFSHEGVVEGEDLVVGEAGR